MLDYCINKLKYYRFKKIDAYKNMAGPLEDEFLFLQHTVIELLTAEQKNELKRMQYLKQIKQMQYDLTMYEVEENKENQQYLKLMDAMLRYELEHRNLSNIMCNIDFLHM